MHNIEIEWKEIAKDGIPKEHGSYLIARETLNTIGYVFLFKDHFDIFSDTKITHWYGPIDTPKKPEKFLPFTEALRMVLDGGKVEREERRLFFNSGKVINSTGIFEKKKNCDAVFYVPSYEDVISKDWKVVVEPPKPKMPDELREFRAWLDYWHLDGGGYMSGSCTFRYVDICDRLNKLMNLYEKES